MNTAYINHDQSNILGYFVEMNAFRGIAMAMQEGIKGNNLFKNYLKNKLGNRFDHFDHINSFVRNVLSHNIDNEIKLRSKNFQSTKKNFIENVNPCGVAKFDFLYSRDLPEESSPECYGFKIELDFQNLIEGQKFTDVISEWHLFMISELSYNLCYYFKRINNDA